MTAIAILEKLLPFTYIDENQNVEFSLWEKLKYGDVIITSVELVLLIIFIGFMFRLSKSYRKDKKQIDTLTNILEKYKVKDISNSYNELKSEIDEKGNFVSKIWKEFDEALIKREDNNGRFVIRNSVDAEYFFNKKSMISHLGSKVFASIPGILLGIGLLGTFTGLYFALVQLDLSNAQTLQESIKVLINMAGIKFAASIWGLFLSVISTLLDKIFEGKLEKKVDDIQILIDQMFVRETAEQNLDSILIQNEQQTQALNTLAESLTEKIANELNATLIPQLSNINTHFENMPQQIATSINATFQKPLEKLSTTVENMGTNQAEKSNEVFETIMKEFLKELKATAGNEGEKMKEVSKQSQEILLSTSQQLQITFKSMQDMLQRQQELSQLRDKKIVQDLEQIKQDQQNMMQNLSVNVTENISSMNQEVSSNITKLVESMNVASSKQQELSNRVEENVINSVNSMLLNIEDSMSKQITLFDTHISDVKSNVDMILQSLKVEVQNIDGALSSASRQLVNLPSYLEKVLQSTDKLVEFGEDLTNSTNNLLTFNDGFVQTQQNLDDFSKNLVLASSELKSADMNLKDTIKVSETLLLDMKNKFGELADNNSDTLDEFSLKVDKYMNDYHSSLANAIQNNVIKQLDNALDTYAQNMGEAITTLSEAIDELREKETK